MHTPSQPTQTFSRPDALYVFDGPIHVVCDVMLTAPLPCRPAFKPSFSSGCLSPGVDCIFYLSPPPHTHFFNQAKKYSMAKIAISITFLLLCVLACHPPLSVSMQDATDSPCRRRNTQTHRCTHNPHVFIKPPHPLFLFLFNTKNMYRKKMLPCYPLCHNFFLFSTMHISPHWCLFHSLQCLGF